MRAALCEEALPLRTLVELLPGESAPLKRPAR